MNTLQGSLPKVYARILSSLLLAAMLVCCNAGQAQEPSATISTERPSVGASPDLVPAGSLQSESGSNLSLQRHAYTADGPENLLRYGLTDRFELRFQSNNAVAEHARSAPLALDSQDAAISGKLLISPPNRPWPRSAIIGLSMPTGSGGQTSGSYDPGVQLIWEQILPRGLTLMEIPAVTLTTFDGGRRPAWAASTSLSRSITPALTPFAEFAPSLSPQGRYAYVIDGGFSLATTTLRQIDLRAGFQHDDAGAHTLLSLGYSFRMDSFLNRFAFSLR